MPFLIGYYSSVERSKISPVYKNRSLCKIFSIEKKKEMERYQDQDIIRLNQTNFKALLQELGFQELRKNLFQNPFRKDQNPSFSVFWSTKLAIWIAKDFSTNQIWRPLEFVQQYKNFSFLEAMRFLEEFNGSYTTSTTSFSFSIPASSPIPTHSEATNKQLNALNYYLKYERKISPTLAKNYVQYRQYQQANKTYYGLFFPTNSQSFVFRNKALQNPIFLGEADISTLAHSDSTEWLLFEGFMDFLSLLTLKQSRPKANVLVLNSVSFTQRTLDELHEKEATKIYTFLDNDKAGKEALQRLKNGLKPSVSVIDKSTMYKPFKDLNDYLQNRF